MSAYEVVGLNLEFDPEAVLKFKSLGGTIEQQKNNFFILSAPDMQIRDVSYRSCSDPMRPSSTRYTAHETILSLQGEEFEIQEGGQLVWLTPDVKKARSV